LFEPDTGKVLVDGTDIRQLGINNYHWKIACVMQDDRLFSGSIRENICGFSEEMDEVWMIECARASYIHDVIMKMPGYETLIGELGEGLSGGQNNVFLSPELCTVDQEYYLWMRLPVHLIQKVNALLMLP
jgi:ATP-binding cassette subfamily B protein RaxB